MSRTWTMLAVAALLAAGCGGDDEEGSADGSGASTTATSPAAVATQEDERQSGSRTAAEGDAPADGGGADAGADPDQATGGDCLTGTYVSSSFVGKRKFDTPFGPIALSGRGRGLELELADGTWTLRGVGRRPMRGRAVGIAGTVKVDGSARGQLVTAEGGRLRFRQRGTEGTVTLTAFGQSIVLPVSVVAASVVPDGPAEATCSVGRLRIDSRSGVLRLMRR